MTEPSREKKSLGTGKEKLEKLLTIDELCEVLGVPRTTVKTMVALGEIPSIKIGRHRRFIPEEVQKWLKKRSA